MNKYAMMKGQVNLYKSVFDHTKEFIGDYLVDTTQPIEERWEVSKICGITFDEFTLGEAFGHLVECTTCQESVRTYIAVKRFSARFCSLSCRDIYDEKNDYGHEKRDR